MLLACWLGTALLLLPATTAAAGAALRLEGDPVSAACSSPGGCDSPESDRKAPCSGDDEKDCVARASGEPCGVYTPGCAPGLRCVPRPGERAPLHALLRGKGVCSPPYCPLVFILMQPLSPEISALLSRLFIFETA
uniref:IGFBP N-terminal domain-containing protein n=1 Tax=Varanus komodoensis TaxID=61221 RepID=A0A8D2LCJ2_VARKO